MELSVRVLCTPEPAAGFALAGLAPDVAENASEATTELRRLVADPATGVVLVEDRLHGGIPEDLRQRVDRQGLPMIVPFPSPAWDVRGLAEEHVLEILRQAIGYRVRPR